MIEHGVRAPGGRGQERPREATEVGTSRLELIARKGWPLPVLFSVLALSAALLFPNPGAMLKHEDAYSYLRAASSLVDGEGLMAPNGEVQILFPPGYPLAIAGVSLLIGDPHEAAVFVSLMASSVSVGLLFSLARRWSGVWVAAVAALLFTMLPLRLWSAQSVLSDSLAVVLIIGAIQIHYARSLPGAGRGVIVGLVLGWAYLTRPEAAITAVGLVAIAVVGAWRSPDRKQWRYVFVACLVLAMVVAGYVSWMHSHTGNWTLSGKTAVLEVIQARATTTSDVEWRGLNADCSAIEVTTPPPSARELAGHYLRNLEKQKTRLLANLGVDPVAGFLLLLGLFTILTDVVCRQKLAVGVWSAILAGPMFVFPLFWIEDRFLTMSAPVLLLWMGVGVVALTRVLQQRREGLWKWGRPWAVCMGGLCLAAILISFGYRLATTSFPMDEVRAAEILAGLINRDAGEGADVGVIGDHPAVPHHAGVRHEWMPYTDLDSLRVYATRRRALYLVVSPEDVRTPATTQLLSGDFQPAEAQELGSIQAGGARLMLFRLAPLDGGVGNCHS